jgi:hypothetical protein
MKRVYEDIYEGVHTLRMEGKSIADIRVYFISSGWDQKLVDRALWRLKLRDRKNSFFLSRARRLAIATGILVGFTGLIAGTISIEKYQKHREKTVAGAAIVKETQNAQTRSVDTVSLRGQPIVSEDAGVSFDYPSDWTLATFSPEDTGGAYQWQLEHIENKPIKEALIEKYDINSQNPDSATVAQLAFLNDPLVEKLSTITISVYKVPDYAIENSLPEWRSQVENANGSMGVSIQRFEDINVSGLPGYKYQTRVALGQLDVSTIDFVLLDTPNRRIEISVFPLKTSHVPAVNAIVNSLQL